MSTKNCKFYPRKTQQIRVFMIMGWGEDLGALGRALGGAPIERSQMQSVTETLAMLGDEMADEEITEFLKPKGLW